MKVSSAINFCLQYHKISSTTQRYLGKVSDCEAIRWIENLHG